LVLIADKFKNIVFVMSKFYISNQIYTEYEMQ